MKMRIMPPIALLLLVSTASFSQEIGYKTAPGAEQKKTLLLRDFQPQSMLHVAEHPVERAKFPVFDVHQHVNDAMHLEDSVPPADLVKRMDELNIETIIVLTGMWGNKLQKVIDQMAKPYPGRFLVFTQIDWSKVDDPDFAQEMVKQIDDGVRRGARGLKILKDFGLGVREKSGKLLA